MNINWTEIKAKIEKAIVLFHETDTTGVTHIASADGNLEDDNLDWIRSRFAEQPPTPKDIEFMDYMDTLTEGERLLAFELHGTVAYELEHPE